MTAATILEVQGLRKVFTIKSGFPRAKTVHVRAVDSVSFTVRAGESFGLVGESGCGKSTVGRCLLQLIRPSAGEVRFKGESITDATRARLNELRRKLQIIFQDPYSSLNPRLSVAHMLTEPLLVHGVCSREEARDRARSMLDDVGLPADAFRKYPHEFSGGQRQRLAIAIILMLEQLKRRRELGFVFISHDLGIVRYFCERVAVMYLGRLVELAPNRDLFDEPLHPYTQALKLASPVPDPAHKVAFRKLEGEVPSPIDPPSGCHFHPRCPRATARCRDEDPQWREVAPQRFVACHHV